MVVFDAECVLCSANALFILKRDTRRRFRLASMQGAAGSAIYRMLGIDPADPETMVVVDGAHVWRDSDGVLAIWRGLPWPWTWLAALGSMVPRILRDPVYRLIARNRYRLFGKRETCWMPDAKDMERVLP
ncbi:hypothetical protein BMF35_a0356 [Aurantiacibacter gangjinensis]|nr:hypothetical protein BMF35_a0356 [Aurantiacibacter gangjinensis]